MKDHILFISPHFDDVALSCGGLVRRLTRTGQHVIVITVCAAKPGDGPLTPFARLQHRQWGEPRDPIGTRLKEDRRAMRLLGAKPAYLGVPDAIYRRDGRGRPLVHSARTLFGLGYAVESALVARVARQLKALAGGKRRALVIAPLAAGRHVDHLLAREAALRLLADGYRVMWYEDFPYAEKRGAVARAVRAIGAGEWTTWEFSIAVVSKIRAVAAYVSQMHSTFRGSADMQRRVRAYARRAAGGDGYAERIWAAGPPVVE